MAAREDQAKPVVLDVLSLSRHGAGGFRLEPLGKLRLRGVEPRAPTHGVDGLEAPGRNEPRPRIGRRTLARPLLDRGGEGFVQRLFSEIEATEQTDERGQDTP